jgi:hypothetical protein
MTHTRRAVFAGLLALPLLASAPAARLGEVEAYSVDVSDVSAAVGAQATLRVRLLPREGFRILDGYNHRVIMLSSFDNDVKFARKMVPGEVQDGALVFAIGVTPTAPGSHAINGVIRVGYIHGGQEMAMVSVPLIANVVGRQ